MQDISLRDLTSAVVVIFGYEGALSPQDVEPDMVIIILPECITIADVMGISAT